eukprot:TRINITY_DN3666_c0_g1_i1.p1 TRINITY_DN3666_c0_g1~~TRINITY_DN3666_c0_g1_i1.p1  ORF type:complete len:318 (-),score=64.83 TRINITY_DN3666_c0_g1_i1:27-980(-)
MAQSQQYVAPTKKITLPAHLAQFQKSKTYSDYIAFILELNDSVKNKKIRDECKISATVEKVLKVFQTLEQYVAETPPLQQTMRYGNKAFRTWFTRVQENAESLMREILPEDKQNAAIELAPYFWDSMGNSTRIDYGTGHETTFVAWMWCLRLLGAVNHEDNTALVLRVFTKYIDLMRLVQQTYMLEPAGSHGVWSLDDYQFLPFFWGSAQLQDHQRILPKSITKDDVVDAYATDYLYLAAIQFVNKMKTGPFFEHSPVLYSITEVPNWTKVNSGLLKMYQAEVLGKFPIMQHFLFGSLIQFEPNQTPQATSTTYAVY